MTPDDNGRPITNRELRLELRSLRWEMRFLILAAAAAAVGLQPLIPEPVREAVGAFIPFL